MEQENIFYPGAIVQFRDEPDRWGVVTCLSDCGECVYYKPRGAALLWVGVRRDLLKVCKQKR